MHLRLIITFNRNIQRTHKCIVITDIKPLRKLIKYYNSHGITNNTCHWYFHIIRVLPPPLYYIDYNNNNSIYFTKRTLPLHTRKNLKKKNKLKIKFCLIKRLQQRLAVTFGWSNEFELRSTINGVYANAHSSYTLYNHRRRTPTSWKHKKGNSKRSYFSSIMCNNNYYHCRYTI